MARKTKAELEMEREAARLEALAAAEAAYPTRLMKALEEAVRENYELTVKNGFFELTNRTDRYPEPTVLSYSYDTPSDWALDQLEYEFRMAAAERAEEERKYAVKTAALAKLSAEERELLGL